MRIFFILSVFFMSLSACSEAVEKKEGVILLHGLCRNARSMKKMAKALKKAGYVVQNIDYPSRSRSVEELAAVAIGQSLKKKELKACQKVHFVTHSLGGILVRSYFSKHKEKRLGRVVMLAPPNQGSEVVDCLKNWSVFQWLNGPAGDELGTEASSMPNTLGAVNFECGILTGNRSFNWINSSFMIKGADDGKVSVEKSKVKGMKAHQVLPVTHTYIMKNHKVIQETLHFLKKGCFTSCVNSK